MSVTRWVSDLGPTNPIILRIVANGSRRTRHLWIRSGFLALLMVALLFGMVGQTSSLRELAQRGTPRNSTCRIGSRYATGESQQRLA